MVVGGRVGLGVTFKVVSIGRSSEVSMAEEEKIGFRVMFAWVIMRSRVWSCCM